MKEASLGQVFVRQLGKELIQSGRSLGPALTPLLFFAVVIALFPLASRPDPLLLARYAPGIVWIAALLATLLALQHMFRQDYDDGGLELMAMSDVPLWFQVLAKQCAHWLLTGLPLVLLAPLAGYALSLPSQAYPALMTGLILGTLTLSALGCLGAALTVGIGQGGLLFSILVLPLVMPALILGARATELAAGGLDSEAALMLLGAMAALSFLLAPFATAAAIEVNLD